MHDQIILIFLKWNDYLILKVHLAKIQLKYNLVTPKLQKETLRGNIYCLKTPREDTPLSAFLSAKRGVFSGVFSLSGVFSSYSYLNESAGLALAAW